VVQLKEGRGAKLEAAAAASHGEVLPSTRHLKEAVRRAAGVKAQGEAMMGELPTPGADGYDSPADLHAMQFEWLPEVVASARAEIEVGPHRIPTRTLTTGPDPHPNPDPDPDR
jgi:hypothetical protein